MFDSLPKYASYSYFNNKKFPFQHNPYEKALSGNQRHKPRSLVEKNLFEY